jgi:hypothetical protein
MSLFSWFSGAGKRKPEHPPSVLPSSGLSRLDATRPPHAARANANAQPMNRKHERMQHRELLYAVVRECMVRASVLSSSYKFKVLSLDPQGVQFMVMIDLAEGASSDTFRLAEIEASIAQTAKARHDILVSAVYWRANEHVVAGNASHPSNRPPISQPAPLSPVLPARQPRHATPERVSGPAELRAAPSEPLMPEEVAAFKHALDAGLRGEQALASVQSTKPVLNPALLTGFEDTEIAGDRDAGTGGRLGPSQYGLLR